MPEAAEAAEAAGEQVMLLEERAAEAKAEEVLVTQTQIKGGAEKQTAPQTLAAVAAEKLQEDQMMEGVLVDQECLSFVMQDRKEVLEEL